VVALIAGHRIAAIFKIKHIVLVRQTTERTGYDVKEAQTNFPLISKPT
jgi:hypothetical protein